MTSILHRAVLCALMAAPLVTAQDAARVSAGHFKIEVDNNRVRALRMNIGPGEKVGMHEHPASVVVFLTNAHLKVTGADGMVRDVAHKAGEVAYNDPVKHAQENVSDEALEAIIVELKPGSTRGNQHPVQLDPVKLDPEHHTVPFENDRVRVLRTVLEPHVRSPLHEHPSYVVVYLTELHTTMTLADGRTVDNPRRAGEVAWREAYSHVTENVGDHTAVEIQIELKQ